MSEKKIAVNLLWLRPGQVGGTEYFIRNLLDGFTKLETPFHFVLICTENNEESFRHYAKDPRFELLTVPISNEGILKRILWQNVHLNRFLKKHGLTYCFSPVYDRPWFNQGVHYTCVIHDIQAVHYPEYHPFHEVVYSKMVWRTNRSKDDFNVAITEYTKQDIVRAFGFRPETTRVIWNCFPEAAGLQDDYRGDGDVDFSALEQQFGLKPGEPYYYTMSQMIPHKNMPTLVKVMVLIRKEHPELPQKLLVSGISGNGTAEFDRVVAEAGLSDCIIKTGYVSNPVKVALYRHCYQYLFPSVFEGFGMTPVEAMELGATVVTTKCTSIPEVTQGLCNYVDDPYDPAEWVRVMLSAVNRDSGLDLSRFSEEGRAEDYRRLLFEEFMKE